MIIFFHIEKAAGTTFNYILRNNYANFIVIPPKGYWTNDPINSFDINTFKKYKLILPKIKGFGGHTLRPFIKYDEYKNGNIKYVTFLRNPVDRYISHYLFQKYEMKIDWNIEEFINEEKFSNFMTKKIAGCSDFELARNLINKKKIFIGILEKFDESLILFKKILNLQKFNICYEKQRILHNAKLEKEKKMIYTNKSLIELINSKNTEDTKLYNYAINKLFKKYISNFGGPKKLKDELIEFKSKNEIFKFSKLKIAIWRTSRVLIFNPIYKCIS